MKNLCIWLCFLVPVFLGCQSDDTREGIAHKTILLIRHAEQSSTSADPPLSKQGGDRAVRLSQMLKEVPLDAVYTTKYLRAKMTAKVVSIPHKLELTEYDTDDLTVLIDELKAMPYDQTAVVVGHSNTTPVVVRMLDPSTDYPQIAHDEFDQIYIVRLFENGAVDSELTNYDAYEKSLSTVEREG